jgi:hypothetical protein
MPFTPAHAAAVLPIIYFRSLSATALVIGSVAPDFEYFFKMSVESKYSHTLAGLFYFDLPVVLFLSVVFHWLVRVPLIYNLPGFLQERIANKQRIAYLKIVKENPVGFVVASLIGAGSHVFWDGFTHGDGFFVKRLTFYDGASIPFQGVHYPLWYALQHISTMVGLAVVGIYILGKKPAHGHFRSPKLRYWFMVVIICLAVVGLRFHFAPSHYNLGNLVVTAISGFCLGLAGAGGFEAYKTTGNRIG